MPRKKEDMLEISKKTRFKSGKEAVNNGRKGGIASGEAKRRKKELKEIIDLLFEKEYTNKDGITLSGAEIIATKQMEKAMKGDTKAFEVLRDTAGQKPVEKVEQVNIDAEYEARVNELRGYFERDHKTNTKKSINNSK